MIKEHWIDCRDVNFCLLDGCKYKIEQHDNQYLIREKRNDKDKECREYNPREKYQKRYAPLKGACGLDIRLPPYPCS